MWRGWLDSGAAGNTSRNSNGNGNSNGNSDIESKRTHSESAAVPRRVLPAFATPFLLEIFRRLNGRFSFSPDDVAEEGGGGGEAVAVAAAAAAAASVGS